jgi:hypothetical protein
MAWRVLSYHLIFALAAGPLLCCCTVGRVLASTQAHPTKSDPDSQQLAEVPQLTSPCCAHKHKLANKSPKYGNVDTKSLPAEPEPKQGEQCPCKDTSSNPRTIQTQTLSPDGSTTLRLLAYDLVTYFAPFDTTAELIHAGLGANTNACRNASFLSSAELLYAHHNLRC